MENPTKITFHTPEAIITSTEWSVKSNNKEDDNHDYGKPNDVDGCDGNENNDHDDGEDDDDNNSNNNNLI